MTGGRPNVLWIFGDQHRAEAVGHMGEPNVRTPNFDRLATEGLVFTHAVSNSPLCSPARGSLLTGRYPHHCVPGHERPLPEGQETVAHVFRAAGYHTAYFGKWHLDGFKERDRRAAMHIIPPERRGGFARWVAYENNNSPWDCWVHGGEGDRAFHERLPGFETDTLTDRMIGYLRERSTTREDPFFAVFSVQPPHDPYAAPEEWMRRHNPAGVTLRDNVPPVAWVRERARRDLAGYYAMIENLDWNLGRIRRALDETGLAADTHLIVFSDHGDLHGSHGHFRKTAPWEEAIRVPMILAGRRPQYGDNVYRTSVPLALVDLAPTTLGLCGLDPPSWMEGTDYSWRRREDRPRRDEPDSALLGIVEPTGHRDSVDRPWRGVTTRDGWKYVALDGRPWLMFNLAEDPYELVNLAHEPRYRAERNQLRDRLAAWLEATADTFELEAED